MKIQHRILLRFNGVIEFSSVSLFFLLSLSRSLSLSLSLFMMWRRGCSCVRIYDLRWWLTLGRCENPPEGEPNTIVTIGRSQADHAGNIARGDTI